MLPWIPQEGPWSLCLPHTRPELAVRVIHSLGLLRASLLVTGRFVGWVCPFEGVVFLCSVVCVVGCPRESQPAAVADAASFLFRGSCKLWVRFRFCSLPKLAVGRFFFAVMAWWCLAGSSGDVE